MKEVVVGEKVREVMGEGHAGPRGWALPECIEPESKPRQFGTMPLSINESESVGRSVVSDALQTPWTAAYQAPPPMGFSRLVHT